MEPTHLAHAIELAAVRGGGRGFRFVKNDKWVDQFHSFEAIEERTRSLGGALQALGLEKGDRVALILPDNAEFVFAFLAALRAGVVPVPIYPPMGAGQLSGYLDNTRHIVERCSAKVLITSPVIKSVLGNVQASCPALRTVTTFAALEDARGPLRPPAIAPDDLAFLQFTSGSTARPKGVCVTHQNLLANIRNINVEGLAIDPTVDSALSWLPLYHDMGLIGFVLSPIVGTIQTTFLSPLTFLFRPSSWLRAMSHYGASMTFGPNFAYALCVKRVREAELEGVDLSHWRVAGCGAEPIRAEALEGFAETFAKVGFRKEAFYPAYGLAESTLAVSFARGVPTDRVQTAALAEGRAVPHHDDGATRIVSCGRPFAGHEIGVFALDDDHSKEPLPERAVGELRLRGPSVFSGYFQDPALSAQAFAGGWYRTGDLGYLADGAAHVCGRSKELLIVRGRNYYPQDIEWAASQVDGVRKGNVIAFGTEGADGEGECVVLAFETGTDDPAAREQLVSAVRARVMEVTGLALEEVLPLAAGVLPKTSSGKLQRLKTRELYQDGALSTRKSVRDSDRVDQVKAVAKSQLAYLRLALFGGRARGGADETGSA